eukprot:gb/GECG01007833.1/.p1 GENE.gb/GECG01007833.1/~~gb/GECG01007833.1/.p1  ORF type:complete len:144 (+),score=12.94 gb/GECG01007833.1/:1-432(+)
MSLLSNNTVLLQASHRWSVRFASISLQIQDSQPDTSGKEVHNGGGLVEGVIEAVEVWLGVRLRVGVCVVEGVAVVADALRVGVPVRARLVPEEDWEGENEGVKTAGFVVLLTEELGEFDGVMLLGEGERLLNGIFELDGVGLV